MNNVTKSIGWAHYTTNPVKGLCPVGCSYCYARRLYGRFKWNPEIRYDQNWWRDIAVLREPSRIFVGSTIELFHPACSEWEDTILWYCRKMPQHTFIFLTKMPQNLPKEWPENCWVGVTIADGDAEDIPLAYFKQVKAAVKFISFEPLLHWWDAATSDTIAESFKIADISWAIIGQQTPVRKATMPKKSWIDEIEEACKKAGIPYFEKDNLKALLNRPLVQQFPVVKNASERGVCPGACSE